MSVQFGKRCKILRQERGLTQQQVADALGISRSAYAYYEIGGSEPSLSVLGIGAVFSSIGRLIVRHFYKIAVCYHNFFAGLHILNCYQHK